MQPTAPIIASLTPQPDQIAAHIAQLRKELQYAQRLYRLACDARHPVMSQFENVGVPAEGGRHG